MQLDPNRPYMTEKEARRFTKDYLKLDKLLSERLLRAETKAEAKQPLEMLHEMAKYELPQAKTFYGLALLMEGKPWYDVEKGSKWLRKGAEEAEKAEHDASYSMYQYGLMLLDGLQGVRQDPVNGKYWMDKAAEGGFKRGATAMFLLNGQLEAHATILVREGRYRVTVDRMVFGSTTETYLSRVGEKTTLEEYALNRKGEIKDGFYSMNAAPIIDYDLSKLFDMHPKEEDDNW